MWSNQLVWNKQKYLQNYNTDKILFNTINCDKITIYKNPDLSFLDDKTK